MCHSCTGEARAGLNPATAPKLGHAEKRLYEMRTITLRADNGEALNRPQFESGGGGHTISKKIRSKVLALFQAVGFDRRQPGGVTHPPHNCRVISGPQGREILAVPESAKLRSLNGKAEPAVYSGL
jgi:hypothetical protein